MEKDQIAVKKFLEEQLQWCKEQDRLLEVIDSKLHGMKRIAEYALKQELDAAERKKLNNQLNELKCEIYFLEKQLSTIVVY